MPSVVINASAGSGKTYRLAVEYLRALLLPAADGRPARPEQVLATTFTRAAASEILERVLRRLALAVVFDAEREKLLKEIGHEELGRDDLAALLAALCQALPQLQVGTLDGLFARVVRVLGTDLAFPTTWTVADETLADELALAAADRLLNGPDKELSRAQWQRYAQFKAGTRVRAALAELLEENRFVLIEAAVAADDPDLAEPLRLTADESEQILRAFDAFADVPLTQKGMPNQNWQKDLARVRAAFAGEVTWISLLGQTLVHRSGQEEARHRGIAIPTTLRALLGPAAKKAGDDLRRLHQGRLPALAALARRYHDVRRLVAFAAAAYRFPEIESAARVLPPHLDQADLYFRLDGQVSHLLLDEFQDTSIGQFRFLWPLIEEVVGNDRLFFAVGDVKQSIYGWRGADRRLLKRLPDFFTPPLSPESLDTNYRSSPAVLRAVDRVFEQLDELACLDPATYTGRSEEIAAVKRKAASSFTEGFAAHVAAGANRDLPGRVRLIITGSGEEADDADEAQDSGEEEAILAAVERHVREDDKRQIAVLCRRRFWIPTLIAALRQRGIEASGEGGSPVTDSAAVELILSLLTWLDHPGHTLAAEHVRRSGMLAAFGLDELKADDAKVRRIRIAIMRGGLAEVMGAWSRHADFLRACTAHDQVRCEQLVELARHANTASGSLSRFVARVRTQRLDNPISSRVRIMTIHGSKGLEFDAVILADLRSGRSGGDGPQFVVAMGAPGEPPEVQLLPRRDDAEALGLGELCEGHEQLRFEEELSVLYVGLTRAKSFLDVVIPQVEKAAPTLERILCEAWDAHEPGEHVIETCEGKTERRADETVSVMPSDPAVWSIDAAYAPPEIEPVPERLDAITPSGKEGAGKVSLGQILGAQNAEALKRGTAVHALFSRIEWNDAIPAPGDWLRSIPASEADPAACKREAPGLHKRLRAVDDPLREIFDRARWLARWKNEGVMRLDLWRERRFSVVLGRELMNGSFDRVVLGIDAAGVPIRAAILDFKTDRIANDEERAARRERYQPQLDAYASALGKMIRLPPGVIHTELIWVG
jgi:ATP-dependent helicase/nuclease subunit A